MQKSPKLTEADLEASRGRRVADLIAPDLTALFCGINPSLYTGATGLHFGRPGNRFYKTLHQSGLTPSQLDPTQQSRLPEFGFGITNVIARATATAAELDRDEYLRGAQTLRRKLKRYQPRWIVFVGIGAYRIISGNPKARVGPQAEWFPGIACWALPNPSGLNATYQLEDLVREYRKLAVVLR